MGTVISQLKAKFGVDTSDFKKGLKEGEQSLNAFKGAGSDILDQFASMFGVNMGAVNDAIGTANKSLNFLGTSFKAAAKGGDIMAISMKVLKFALISTGIGAIVVALGSLIAYFKKSGEGSDKFAKIMMQLRSVIDNVIERLAIFGKGMWEIVTGKFKQGWQDMTSAFKGMGTEIKEDWKAAGQLADALDALEDKEIAMLSVQEERKTKAEQLRTQAKEETEDMNKKLALLKESKALYKLYYDEAIALETQRLALMQQQLNMQTKDPTDEQRRSIQEQILKVQQLKTAQQEQMGSYAKMINSTNKAVDDAFKKFNSYSQLKIPQLLNQKVYDNINQSLKGLHHTAISLGEEISSLYLVMGQVSIDATKAINEGLTSMAEGFGEFIGNLASGQASMGDFGKLIGTVFADMAINVGKVAIGAGMAVLGIKEALMSLNPYVAIAAGIALVALGYAIKGSLKSAASGGGSASGASSSPGSFTYDTTTTKKAAPIEVHITGKLTGKGSDLAAIIDYESNRKRILT
jgi:hypothetical protein